MKSHHHFTKFGFFFILFFYLTVSTIGTTSQSLVHVDIITSWIEGTSLSFRLRGDDKLISPLKFQIDFPADFTVEQKNQCIFQEMDESDPIYFYFWIDCHYLDENNIVTPAGTWSQDPNYCHTWSFYPYGTIPANTEVICLRRVPAFFTPQDPSEPSPLTQPLNLKKDLGNGYELAQPVTIQPSFVGNHGGVNQGKDAFFTLQYNQGISYDDDYSRFDRLDITFKTMKLPEKGTFPLSLAFYTTHNAPDTIVDIPFDLWSNSDFTAEMGHFASFLSSKIEFNCGEGIRLFFDGESYSVMTSHTPSNNAEITCTIPINIKTLLGYLEFESLGNDNQGPIHIGEHLIAVVLVGNEGVEISSWVDTNIILGTELYTMAQQTQTIAELRLLPTIMSSLNPLYQPGTDIYYFGMETEAITTREPIITLVSAEVSQGTFSLTDLLDNNNVAFRAYYSTTKHSFAPSVVNDNGTDDNDDDDNVETPSDQSSFTPLPDDAIAISFSRNRNIDNKTPHYASTVLYNTPDKPIYIKFEFEFPASMLISAFAIHYTIDSTPLVWQYAPQLIPSRVEYMLLKPNLLGFRTTLQFDFSSTPLLSSANSTLTNQYAIQYFPGSHEIRSQFAADNTQCDLAVSTYRSTGGNSRRLMLDNSNRLELVQRSRNYGNDQLDGLSNWFLLLRPTDPEQRKDRQKKNNNNSNKNNAQNEISYHDQVGFNPTDIITINCTIPLNPNAKPALNAVLEESYITFGDYLNDNVTEYYFDGLNINLKYPNDALIKLRQEQFQQLQLELIGGGSSGDDTTDNDNTGDNANGDNANGESHMKAMMNKNKAKLASMFGTNNNGGQLTIQKLSSLVQKSGSDDQTTKADIQSNENFSPQGKQQQQQQQQQATQYGNVFRKNSPARRVGIPLKGAQIAQQRNLTQDMNSSFTQTSQQTSPKINNNNDSRSPNNKKPLPRSKNAILYPLFLDYSNNNNTLLHSALSNDEYYSTLLQLQDEMLIQQRLESQGRGDLTPIASPKFQISSQSTKILKNSKNNVKLPDFTPSRPITGVVSPLEYYFYNREFNINSIGSVSYPETIEWNESEKIEIAIIISFASLDNITTPSELTTLLNRVRDLLLHSTPNDILQDPQNQKSLFYNFNPDQLVIFSPWNQFIDGVWFPFQQDTPTKSLLFPAQRLTTVGQPTSWLEFGIPLSTYTNNPNDRVLLDVYNFYRYVLRDVVDLYFWNFDLISGEYKVPHCLLQPYQSNTDVEHVPACRVSIGAPCYSSGQCISGLCLDQKCIYGDDLPRHFNNDIFNHYVLEQTNPTAKYFTSYSYQIVLHPNIIITLIGIILMALF